MNYLYEIRFWLGTAITITTLIILVLSPTWKRKGWLAAFLGTFISISLLYYLYNKALTASWLKYESTPSQVAQIALSVLSLLPEAFLLVFVISICRRSENHGSPRIDQVHSQLGQAQENAGPLFLKGLIVKRTSFASVVTMVAVGSLFSLTGLLLLFAGNEQVDTSVSQVGGALAILGFIFSILIAVRCAIYIHRMWVIVQDGNARTTPGQAVGLLFIPVFNFIWVYTVFWGWSKDYNSMLKRYGMVDAPRVSEALFLAVAVIAPLGVVPVLNLVVAIPQTILGLMVMAQICTAINFVADIAVKPCANSNVRSPIGP